MFGVVRVRVDNAGSRRDLSAQVFRPAGNGCFAAVAIARMAGLLRDWAYVALVVDSFSSRGLTDVCGHNWPTEVKREGNMRNGSPQVPHPFGDSPL